MIFTVEIFITSSKYQKGISLFVVYKKDVAEQVNGFCIARFISTCSADLLAHDDGKICVSFFYPKN